MKEKQGTQDESINVNSEFNETSNASASNSGELLGDKDKTTEKIEASADVLAMTQEEAKAYFELPSDVSAYDLDRRFWQWTKRYRAEKDEQKLADIAAAYDIASGIKAREEAVQEKDAAAKKYMGKSAAAWKTFFYYEWWKFVLGLVVLIVAGMLIKQIVFTPAYDLNIVSVGHFTMDNEFMVDYAKDTFGAKNPYITHADVTADNEEGAQNSGAYNEQTATVLLALEPEVIIYDAMTAPYYFDKMAHIESEYNKLIAKLSDEALDYISPYYCSRNDYYAVMESYYQDYPDDRPDPADGDDLKYLCGIEITDPVVFEALGYISGWNEEAPSLIITINSNSDNQSRALDFVTELLDDLPNIRGQYTTNNAGIESSIMSRESSRAIMASENRESRAAETAETSN